MDFELISSSIAKFLCEPVMATICDHVWRMHFPRDQFLRTFQAYKIGELGLKETWNVRLPSNCRSRGQRRQPTVDSSLAAHSSSL